MLLCLSGDRIHTHNRGSAAPGRYANRCHDRRARHHATVRVRLECKQRMKFAINPLIYGDPGVQRGCSTTQTDYKTSEPIALADVVELANNDKYIQIGYGHSAACAYSFVSFGTKTVYYLLAH
jgi:hypothetical protein